MGIPFRHAMCNEAFKERPFLDQCRALSGAGYEGIEIAPFTLGADPLDVSAARRRELRDIMAGEGLRFVGLHWLLVTPLNLHVTTPDAALRERSWQYVWNLVDLCADLGDDGVLVFGSPEQRKTTGGATVAEATRYFTEGLAQIAPHADNCGVTVLVEALPAALANVVRTLEEAVAAIHQIGNPAIRTMFDVHNTADETEPHEKLIARYGPQIRHVHVNEMDGGCPGAGDYDFVPMFRALNGIGYKGWISLEVFDFETDPDKIARDSITYLKRKAEEAQG
jgi:D-psicose/D-tagatose/L-ribulose 3-epimerase